jgi:preprotein translocase subunit SecE
VKINRKQRRSSKRSEQDADVVVSDDSTAELDEGDDESLRAGGSSDDLDGGDVDGGDLDGSGPLDRDGDLDGAGDLADAPVRPGRRAPGDTIVDRVARPRPATSGTTRSGIHPRQFLHEVNVELRKVAWPTRKETINYSSVVLVTLSVLMALIFGLDYGFDRLSIFLFK